MNNDKKDILKKRATDRRSQKRNSENSRDRDRAERKYQKVEKDNKSNLTFKNKNKKVYEPEKTYQDTFAKSFLDKIKEEEITEEGKSRKLLKKEKGYDKDEDFGVGTEKKHKESKAEKLNDIVNDGKDVFRAVSQTNTKDELKKMAKSVATINPFKVSSIKNGVDDAVNNGIKMGLDKTAFGLGTILEKVNKRLPIPFLKKTKDGKIDYSSKQPMLKIILWVIAIGIFVAFWVILALIIFMIIILSASFFAVNDGKVSVGSGNKNEQTSTDKNNNKDLEGVETPKELEGVVIMPVVEHATSGWGGRTINGVYEFHYGFDLQQMPKVEPPVYANMEGTIIAVEKRFSGSSGGAKGNYVVVYNEKYKIAVSNQHMAGYGKIPEVAKNMQVGNKVKLSTRIGSQGTTGMGNGVSYHLHIDTYINVTPAMAKNFNPYKYYNSKYAVSPSTLLHCPNFKLPVQPSFGMPLPASCKKFAREVRGLK